MFGHYFISDTCPFEDHICEINYAIPEKDNFEKDYTLIYLIVIGVILNPILSVCYTKLHKFYIQKEEIVYRYYMIAMTIIGTLYYGLWYNLSSNDVCSFPIDCHEGINDTIITSNYYYEMRTCPRVKTRVIDFYNKDKNEDCENSEYGCCEIIKDDIICVEFEDDIDSYNEYENLKKIYNGVFGIETSKIDEKGSNCPTIGEIIYDVSMEDRPNYVSFFILSYIFMILIMSIILSCHVKNMINYHQVDVENQMPQNSIKKKSDEINGSVTMTGSA
jgi:hypothetical protein